LYSIDLDIKLDNEEISYIY